MIKARSHKRKQTSLEMFFVTAHCAAFHVWFCFDHVVVFGRYCLALWPSHWGKGGLFALIAVALLCMY